MVGKDLIMATLFGSGGGSSGSGGGGVRMTTGTILFASDTSITEPDYWEVEHGLGTMPDLIVVIQGGVYLPYVSSPYLSLQCTQRYIDNGAEKIKNITNNGSIRATRATVSEGVKWQPTENMFCIGAFDTTSTTKILGNTPLEWYAFRWEE